MALSLETIGVIRSCFTAGFAVPRQPGLAPEAKAELILQPPYDDPQALAGLEQCSHIWLQFVFHREPAGVWKPRVRPPRLGGNRSLGVFATRSPRRPNRLGLSVVRLEGVAPGRLQLSGVDLIDGTPVVDIKPYVPYADSLPQARNTLAPAPPEPLPVVLTKAVRATCAREKRLDLARLIEQVLTQDPRPAYQPPDPGRRYGTRLLDWELGWYYHTDAQGRLYIEVSELVPAD